MKKKTKKKTGELNRPNQKLDSKAARSLVATDKNVIGS